jgi:hypothetical protein
MKTIPTIIALAAAGFLGHSAFANGNCQPPQGLAVIQNGHGQQRFEYFPQNARHADTSVALYTNSGEGAFAPLGIYRPLPDNGEVKLVEGTNQHGQATTAYIPVSSHYSPAGQ